MTNLESLKSWPFIEAQKISDRLKKLNKASAVFETGYGPSGLPHIGTFGEVARTSWVRKAFKEISSCDSKLIAFSDDMDGLRKVPENVPNRSFLSNYINQPLTAVPDPFDTHSSFGEHNNSKLCKFLDRFGFEYEFASSTDYYKNGKFNSALIHMLSKVDEIREVILPTLGPDRRSTYSPLMPIHPVTNQVMQVPILDINYDLNTIIWEDYEGIRYETSILDGNCKAQWKADWALRWYALDVDYEMSGKDLIDSVTLSGKIVRILGGTPPVNMTYELFLDNNGHKISKSVGNGVSIEQWLKYAPEQSLSYYMYENPKRAKKISLEVIPKYVNEAITASSKEHNYNSPFWFFDDLNSTLSYSMLLNMVSVLNANNVDTVWAYISRYQTLEQTPNIKNLIVCAINYFNDVIKPTRQYKSPNEMERIALLDLRQELLKLTNSSTIEEIQYVVFEVGKRHPFTELRLWFQSLYQVLLGANEGPRFGGFVHLYGINETIALIDSKLS